MPPSESRSRCTEKTSPKTKDADSHCGYRRCGPRHSHRTNQCLPLSRAINFPSAADGPRPHTESDPGPGRFSKPGHTVRRRCRRLAYHSLSPSLIFRAISHPLSRTSLLLSVLIPISLSLSLSLLSLSLTHPQASRAFTSSLSVLSPPPLPSPPPLSPPLPPPHPNTCPVTGGAALYCRAPGAERRRPPGRWHLGPPSTSLGKTYTLYVV